MGKLNFLRPIIMLIFYLSQAWSYESNLTFKSNFMLCLLSGAKMTHYDTRWWCGHCYEGWGTWLHPASSSVWCGDNGAHWAHYLTNSADLYSDTTLNTSHVPGNCTAALLTTAFAGMGNGRNQLQNKLTPREGTEKFYVFLEIFFTALLIRCNGQREELCCAWVYILSALVN